MNVCEAHQPIPAFRLLSCRAAGFAQIGLVTVPARALSQAERPASTGLLPISANPLFCV